MKIMKPVETMSIDDLTKFVENCFDVNGKISRFQPGSYTEKKIIMRVSCLCRDFLLLAICTCLFGCSGGDGNDGVSSFFLQDDINQVIKTEGPGDINNLFPLTIGNSWGYHVTSYGTGKQSTNYTESVKISGTKYIDNNAAYVLTSFNSDNLAASSEEYYVKNNAAIYYVGDNSISLSSSISPYPIFEFPVVQNGSFLQIKRSHLDYGSDLDGDGINEKIAINSNVTTTVNETVRVEVGMYQNCTRVVTSMTETLTSSRDNEQLTVNGTMSEWYAPGIGLVKRHVEYVYPNGSSVTDYALTSYIVDGIRSETTSPTILSVQPNANATSASVSTIDVLFSEDMDASTINSVTFTVQVSMGASYQSVPGTISYSNKKASFVSRSALQAGTYTATISTAAQDVAGNSLANDYRWSFTVDKTAPNVSSTYPAPNAVSVPVFPVITATFSEEITPATVDSSVFVVKDSNNDQVDGHITYVNKTATFIPKSQLNHGTTYTAMIRPYVKDLSGNILPTSYSWTFTTDLGVFSQKIRIPTGSRAEAVAIGDVNGDGKNDVVLTTSSYNNNAYDYKFFVYLQNSAGSLAPPIIYSTSGSYTDHAMTVAIGDINNDGKNDVTIGYPSKFEVFYQNKSGGLDPAISFVATDTYRMKIVDINKDGLKDVIGIGWASVSIWKQNANGTLDPPQRYFVTLNGYNDLDVGDVNNDRLNDIIVSSGQGLNPTIAVLTGKADGALNGPVYYSTGNAATSSLAVGDINGDNLNDIVSGSAGAYYQNNSGSLSPLSPNYYGHSIVMADVNNDGRNDLIVQHWGQIFSVGVYLQNPDGTLSSEDLYMSGYGNYRPGSFAVGDINGDGFNDAVVVDYDLTLLYNTATSGLGKKTRAKSKNGKLTAGPIFKGVKLKAQLVL
ncbi:MAG: Ig-like domain-containing protein [Pelobacteraceae bacterium]